MDNITTSLQQLTKGLLYIGESEFPFEVMNLGHIKEAALLDYIERDYGSAGTIKSITTPDFFDNYIYRLTASGDDIMMKDIDKYKMLQSFINQHFGHSMVYKYGATKVGVYIACTTKLGEVFVLKTFTVET
jgi:hypothetical protein